MFLISVYFLEPRGKDSYFYMGSEMKILEVFSKHVNATILPVINPEDYWGEIWSNWSGSGLMGNLVEDKADIGAGTERFLQIIQVQI